MTELIDTYSVEESNPNFEKGRCLPKHGYFIKQTNKLYNANNGLIFFNEEHDNYIFKLCYPIGSIFITKQFLTDLGATVVSNTNPDNIRYSWHGCIFRYLYSPVGPDTNVNQQSYLASGEVKQNPDGTYKEKKIFTGGVNRNQFILNGAGYVQPHTLTIAEMPNHSHPITPCSMYIEWGSQYNSSNECKLTAARPDSSWCYNLNYIPAVGGNQPHSHNFNATVKIPINPSYIGALFYERIQ